MKKNKKMNRNDLIILIAVILCGFTYLLNLCGVFDLRLNLAYTNEYNISNVNNINFDMLYYDLEVKTGSNDKIIIKYYGNDKENIDITSSTNKDLNIEMINHKFSHENAFLKQKVVVILPKSYIGTLNINSTDGDIIVKNNFNVNANIETTDGDICLTKINKLTIKSDDGDVSINKVRVLDLEVIDSEVNISDIKDEASIMTVEGDISINKFNLTNNSIVETRDGDISIKNIKNASVDVSDTIGDKIIAKSYKGTYQLKVNTIKGDIIIR